MILLADAAVALVDVAIDTPATGDVVTVVRAGERGPLGDPEVGLDGSNRTSKGPHSSKQITAARGGQVW